MGNASTFAQAHQLRPWVALSAEQMAQLTSDIVWLVEKDITLKKNREKNRGTEPGFYDAPSKDKE